MRIGQRIQLALLLVGLLPLSLTALLSYERARSMLESSAVRHLRSVATLQEKRLGARVDQNTERLRLVSSRTQLRISLERFLASDDPAELATMSRILADAKRAIADFKAISVATRDGRILISTDAAQTDKRVDAEPAFIRGLNSEQAATWRLADDGLPYCLLSGPSALRGELLA